MDSPTYVYLYNLISTSNTTRFQEVFHRSCLIALLNDIMVYIKSWTEYQAQAERLYEQQPDRVSDRFICADQGIIITKANVDEILRKI
jgi:hypothetical protein